MQVGIEPYTILGIRLDLCIRFEPVRHVGKSILSLVEQSAQRIRIMLVTNLQQAQQIDDLMVSPIADVRPRVLRFDHFPVEALIRNAVGIIPVRSGRIEELRNDMINIERIGVRESFPVLEDIPPVALVSHYGLPVLVLHMDCEHIPGS